jgi:hypothetical protein
LPPNLSNPPRYRVARLLLLLALVPTHLKSGGENSDEFRRALESFRLRQIASAASRDGVPSILLGDMNADSGDPPLYPDRFTSVPSGLPTGLVVGADIRALLAGAGLANNPFAYLAGGGSVLPARQLDGNDATRPVSGRRIDYRVTFERGGRGHGVGWAGGGDDWGG